MAFPESEVNEMPPPLQPYLSAGEEAGLAGWREDLARAAQFPGVFCKLSGLVTEVDPDNHREHFTPQTFRQPGWHILFFIIRHINPLFWGHHLRHRMLLVVYTVGRSFLAIQSKSFL